MVDPNPHDSSRDELSEEQKQEDGVPPVNARYSFSRFARDSWGHYRSSVGPLVAIFCVVHIVAAVLPYLILFDVPDAVGYPLVFLFRVVIPVVLGSFAVALASFLLMDRGEAEPDAQTSVRGALAAVRSRVPEVLILALIASLMGAGAVLALGAYGFLILHLFYGPPVATQVLTLERRPYRDALERARMMLRGNWRMMLYLLNSALAIGALSLLILDLVVRVVGDGSDAVVRPVLGLAQGLVLGTLTAFMGGAQMAVYLYLRDQQPIGSLDEGEAVTPGAAPSQG